MTWTPNAIFRGPKRSEWLVQRENCSCQGLLNSCQLEILVLPLPTRHNRRIFRTHLDQGTTSQARKWLALRYANLLLIVFSDGDPYLIVVIPSKQPASPPEVNLFVPYCT